MTALDVVSLVLGLAGVTFGVRCYVELYRWARQCQRARIAIAYKRKVKIDAPLVEWLTWANALDHDARTKDVAVGRPVFSLGGATVVIRRAALPKRDVLSIIRKARRRRRSQAPAQGRVEAA